MKKFLLLALIALCYWNCQEDTLETYDGQDGVYFVNLYGGRILTLEDNFSDTTNFSFAFVTVQDTVFRLGVRAMGKMAGIDRPFSVRVVSTNAQEGVHYDALEPEYLIPADTTDGYVPVHIYRENIDPDTTFYIELELVPNQYFTQNMPFKEITESGVTDTLDITRHVLTFDNKVSQPMIWSGIQSSYGEWTEAKFNFINETFGMNPGDWYGNNSSVWMTLMNKATSGAVFVTNYLNSLISEENYTNYPKDPDNTNPAAKGYLTIPGITIPAGWPDASTLNN